MAITFSTTARNALCDAAVDLCDGGTLEIGTTGMGSVLVTFNLPTPAFGSAVNGVATANAITKVDATGDGEAAAFRVKNSSAQELWTGTVATSSADIIIDNTTIVSGQTYSISSWTHTQPAS